MSPKSLDTKLARIHADPHGCGRVNYFTPEQTNELLEFKKRLGLDDPRLKYENCDLCANNLIRPGYREFEPEPVAFKRQGGACPRPETRDEQSVANGELPDMEGLVKTITDQIMASV